MFQRRVINSYYAYGTRYVTINSTISRIELCRNKEIENWLIARMSGIYPWLSVKQIF